MNGILPSKELSIVYVESARMLQFAFSLVSIVFIIILAIPACILCSFKRKRSNFNYQIILCLSLFSFIHSLPPFYQIFLSVVSYFHDLFNFKGYPLIFKFFSAFCCYIMQVMRFIGGSEIMFWTFVLSLNTQLIVQNPFKPASRFWPSYVCGCCSCFFLFLFLVTFVFWFIQIFETVFISGKFYPYPIK